MNLDSLPPALLAPLPVALVSPESNLITAARLNVLGGVVGAV